MKDFLNEILGQKLLITIRVNDAFTLTCNGDALIVKDEKLVIGKEDFSFSVDNLYNITKEDNLWMIKITENVVIYISVLDNIR